MLSYRRISRSLVTILTLTLFQVISPVSTLFTNPANAAISQINVESGTTYGGTGGTASSPALCSNGAVTGLKASSTVGTYSYGFGFTCTPFAANGSLGSPSTYTDVVTTAARDLSQSCPNGQVGIGIKVRVNSSMVAQFALKCGNPMSQNNSSTLEFIPNTIANGTDSTYTCASGKVLVGFTGKFGAGVDQLTPRCASYSGFVYAGIGAPVITNMSYRSASVAFTALTDNYADTFLNYTVTATPPSGPALTGTGQLSPIAVTGLSSGVNYTYSVTGSNAYGATAAATGSASLTSLTSPNNETDTAFSITGTQYAWQSDTGTGGVFDITGAITLEAWVFPTETGTAQYTVICKSEAYQLFHKDGVWKYALWGSSSWGSGISTSVPVQTNEWHHIAITRAAAANAVNFYYDGYLVYDGTANTATTSTIADNSFQFGIGGMIYGGPSLQYPFKGSIDHVALFSTVRDQATIKGDMHSYLSASTAGLRAFYDFNEGEGSTLIYNRVSGATANSDLAVVGSPNFPDVKQVTNSGNYTTVKFPRSYLTSVGGWRIPAGVTKAQSLVIGGGGAGGSRAGGGGGAGLYVYDNSLTLTPNRVETITVGQGGVSSLTGGSSGAGIFEGPYGGQGNNGQNTIFTIYTADGGGGGGGAAGSDDTWRNGLNGGSGGGASGSSSGLLVSATPGATTKNNVGRGYGNGNGGGNGRRSDNWPAGGGGGSATTGGVGGTPTSTTSKAGDGGAGTLDPIGGTTLCYAAGGGAGTQSTSAGGGGSAGSCVGGTSTASAGTKGASSPPAATANSGSGGGGSGWIDNVNVNDVLGGSGGSGVVIIKYLVVTAVPIFTGPNNDTTTAGLTATLSVTGSPETPFIRSYQWLLSTDTGSTWTYASVGTGATTATYTTQVLTTAMSGSRYQYRVVVTDTDGGLLMRETSTAVYLIVNPAITFTGSYTQYKYGQTHTDTFTTTVGTGTGNKTFAFTPNNRSYISWDTSTANTAALTVSRYLGPGTYYETMTATDTKGAQSLQMISIVVGKADTVTVTALAVSDTYTGSALTFTNRYSISGLVNSDTVTSMSYTYAGTANGGAAYSSSSTRPINAGSYLITPVPAIQNSDSYTAVVVDTGTLTINRATRSLSISTKPSTLKYGSSSTLGVTTTSASDGALTFTSNSPSFCSISGDSLTAIASYNSCSYLATIGQGNNYETATSTSASTTLAKADTLTVSTNAISPVTYTAAQANVTPTFTVTGLKLTDSVVSNSVWYQYGTNVVTGGTTSTTWSNNPPVDADLYTVNPYALILSSGTLDNYENVNFVDGTLQILRAQQAALSISQYSSTFGIPYRVQIFGGSGTGAVSATVSAGTATNCSISGDTLTTTTPGSCWLVAQKNGDKNYETQTASIFVYFLEWIPYLAPVVIPSSPIIALDSVVEIIRDANAAPLVTTVSASNDATYPVAINGLGFTDVTSNNLQVKFWRGKVVAQGDFIVKSNTLIWSKVPVGATMGRVIVTNPYGSGASTNSFTP